MSLIMGAGSFGLEKILADGQALLDEAQQLMEQTEAAQGLVAQNKSAAQQAATSAANLATAVTLMVHAINQINSGNTVNIDTLLSSLIGATQATRQAILDVQSDVASKQGQVNQALATTQQIAGSWTGWTPVFSVTADNDRQVLRVIDWTGGLGNKPTSGQYVGNNGLTTTLANAVDIRGGQGATGKGWTPILTLVVDGPRLVLGVSDWAGGEGTKPATGQYVGSTGFTTVLANAVDVRGTGNKGWSPVFANVVDGSRIVQQVVDWTGGEGSKPTTGQYVSASGLTATLASATDIRGVPGPTPGNASALDYTPSTTVELRTTANALDSIPGGLGDRGALENVLLVFGGDSTTEQGQGNGYLFDALTVLRKPGRPLEKIAGTINFGGSGYTLDAFVTGGVQTLPVIPTSGNMGVGNWDYYGHKPIGAISLATMLAWLDGKADRAIITLCLGINDAILNAAVGNLTQAQITDYIATRLRKAIVTIQKVRPKDRIVLRVPNPMTARPFLNAGFPSTSAYPTFGQNLAADQALVEKWNQGLRNGYLAVRNDFPGVVLFDTWTTVFGMSDTTKLAGTELPMLGDLVHPSGTGYGSTALEWTNLVVPTTNQVSESRKTDAAQKATNLGGNAWDYYALYFRNNPKYKKVADLAVAYAGSNYLDLTASTTEFYKLTGAGAIFVVINGAAAQYFSGYSYGASGANTRLLGVAPTAAMQAASGGSVEIYQDNTYALIANDAYLNTTLATAKEYYTGKISGGGNGYLDLTLDANRGRVSTKFVTGLQKTTLSVGGTIGGSVTINSLGRSGTSAQRLMRVFATGDYTSYINQPCAFWVDDTKPSPKIYEVLLPIRQTIPHAQNGRGFLYCPLTMSDGAVFSVQLSEPIAAAVTVEVYSLTYPTRTLVTTITVSANTGGVTASTGNPASISAGQTYEFIITSATSQTTGVVGLTLTPN